jgi:L-glutamine-phosphate cytidylyltransferase
MKAIITCAGMGTRLGSHSAGKPKSMLELPTGKPLIVYTIETLKSLGFTKVVLVVGYKKEIIEDAVKDFGDFVKIYNNPFFSVSGTAGSMFHARDEFDGSSKILLMNGDSFYIKEIYQELLSSVKSPILLIDKSRKDIADMKIRLDKNDFCIEYDKGILNPDAESCDLMCISADYSKYYKTFLEHSCFENIKTAWWEGVIIDNRSQFPVHTLDVNGKFWSEIDFIEDYERIIKYFKQ